MALPLYGSGETDRHLVEGPQHKTGAIVVGPDREIRATGYNGLVRGVNDDIPERMERPTKYDFFEHAERNAVYNACLTRHFP